MDGSNVVWNLKIIGDSMRQLSQQLYRLWPNHIFCKYNTKAYTKALLTFHFPNKCATPTLYIC